MRKTEIQKSLRKLRNVFDDDAQALEALDLLSFKVEAFPEDKKEAVVDFSTNFPLPDEMQELTQGFAIFADGACRGNPGPGAWATMIQDTTGEVILKSSGVDVPTTNNKMEMEGVIRGLKGLIEKWIEEGTSDPESPVFVYSDSKYVTEGIEKWVIGWKARGWKKADNKEPENLLLWKELDQLKSRFNHIKFLWVKGHAGHPQNEMCDRMANLALDEAGF
ncbi:MAG: ribonuclease HI [Bacteriovorax sp.]|nr:ribonuclease HI [Bacteriovorax sp.]